MKRRQRKMDVAKKRRKKKRDKRTRRGIKTKSELLE